jgi:hypothetical protein
MVRLVRFQRQKSKTVDLSGLSESNTMATSTPCALATLATLVAMSHGLQMSVWQNAGQGGTPTVSHVDGLGSLNWDASMGE